MSLKRVVAAVGLVFFAGNVYSEWTGGLGGVDGDITESDRAMLLVPDVQQGKEIYSEKFCIACHQDHALGIKAGSYPRIAGQHPFVILKQLADFRHKDRDAPVMFNFASAANIGGTQAMADVAAYISSLDEPKQKVNGIGPGNDLELGKKLYRDNCLKCHGEYGEGKNYMYYPRLQGQHYEYMLRQFQWIRDGKRRRANPEMEKLIAAFSEHEMKSVLDYTSRLEFPEGFDKRHRQSQKSPVKASANKQTLEDEAAYLDAIDPPEDAVVQKGAVSIESGTGNLSAEELKKMSEKAQSSYIKSIEPDTN